MVTTPPVPDRLAILRMVEGIFAQQQSFFLRFAAPFPEKGQTALYQVAESFRPAMAREYKLAQANMAYSRFSFFARPRYTVFLYPNWHLMIRNACSTLHRTEDFRFSIYRSQSMALSDTWGSLPGRRLIRKLIFEKCSFVAISGRFWTPR